MFANTIQASATLDTSTSTINLEPGSPRAWKILITCWTWLDMVGRGLQSFDHTLQYHTLVVLASYLARGHCWSSAGQLFDFGAGQRSVCTVLPFALLF